MRLLSRTSPCSQENESQDIPASDVPFDQKHSRTVVRFVFTGAIRRQDDGAHTVLHQINRRFINASVGIETAQMNFVEIVHSGQIA